MCVSVCVYIHIYIDIYPHTHTPKKMNIKEKGDAGYK